MDYRQSLVYAVDMVAKNLKHDFGNYLKARFDSDNDLSDWKNRLYAKLKGLHPQDILDGYDMVVDKKPSHMPEIPELLSATLTCQKERVRAAKNMIESEQIALMSPRQEISGSVARQNLAKIRGLASESMANMENTETPAQRDERLARLKQKTVEHDAIMDDAFKGQVKAYIDPAHQCNVGWCGKPGVKSTAITGNGNFYCRDHYTRQS